MLTALPLQTLLSIERPLSKDPHKKKFAKENGFEEKNKIKYNKMGYLNTSTILNTILRSRVRSCTYLGPRVVPSYLSNQAHFTLNLNKN